MLRRRLARELRQIQKGGDPDIRVASEGDNLMRWSAWIRGTEDTPYAEGVFELRIVVGDEYPMVPPRVEFVTPVFHANVHFRTGEICLDILKRAWSPAWDLMAVCRAIRALLASPEADSPLNCDAGNMLRAGDVLAYNSTARMFTLERANRELPAPAQ